MALTVAQDTRLAPTRPTDWERASDLELVRAATEDMGAFAELIRRHQAFVFGAVLRVVKDRSRAEDIAQEVFLCAHRGFAAFRGDAAVRSWLYRIASNLAINWVTRRREHPTDRMPDRPDAALGPSDVVEVAELRANLSESIAELSDGLRIPLVLREIEELSYQEIADTLGLPLNTVRTRILRGRRMLREKAEAWQ